MGKLLPPCILYSISKKIKSTKSLESKNCLYFVQINDSNDEEENSSIKFVRYHNWTYNISVEYTVLFE